MWNFTILYVYALLWATYSCAPTVVPIKDHDYVASDVEAIDSDVQGDYYYYEGTANSADAPSQSCNYSKFVYCICHKSEKCGGCKQSKNISTTCYWEDSNNPQCGYLAAAETCGDDLLNKSITATHKVDRAFFFKRFCPRISRQTPQTIKIDEDVKFYPNERCGIIANSEQQKDAVEFRVGLGFSTQRGDWPWHVALRFESSSRVHCGGILIGDRWVLTARHCLRKTTPENCSHDVFAENLLFMVSKYDLMQREDVNIFRHPQLIFTPDKSLKYEKYERHDLALVLLDKPVDWVNPACLPPANFNTSGVECLAIGFGVTKETKGEKRRCNFLQEVYLRELNHARCKMESAENLRDRICAGSKVGGTCDNDSGGGVFCAVEQDGKMRWVLHGVTVSGVQRGARCPEPAGVYERVEYYMDWIKLIMGQDSINYTDEMIRYEMTK